MSGKEKLDTPNSFLMESKLPVSETNFCEDPREVINWRKSMLAGYCSDTGERHQVTDFDGRDGLLSKIGLINGYVCTDCGLYIEEESYLRLKELRLLEENLDEVSRQLIVNVSE